MQKVKIQNLIGAAFTVFFALSFQSVQAETTRMHFDVTILGLKAGELRYTLHKDGTSYAASGLLYPTGLAATMTTFLYDVTVTGSYKGDQYSPSQYSEKSDTGKRKEEREIIYRSGVPNIRSAKLSKTHWLDPKTQRGTLDPMTAILEILRDVDHGNLCDQDVTLFDGARRVRISLSNPSESGGRATCDGIYSREGGFSKNELKQGKTFPFTITYQKTDQNYYFQRFDVKSARGRAAFVRR
ncbi:MAG: DUF3108 domain-containing protein [Paracoccaceae bacterium]|jgi:hypothetical protein